MATSELVGGRYRLGAKLGAGGMATVHRAWDTRLERAVAVKLYRPGSAEAEDADGYEFDARQRFRDEALALSGLSHPGLVSVYDCGTDGDRPYLVLQLVQGRTLRQRIAEGPMAAADMARLGARLADALAHVHDGGVVHRDVKPANVLLDAQDRPYLADFGVALLAGAPRRTASGMILGTASYLAPEQVLGRPVTTAVDVYALGLVLLECVTGRTEYGGTAAEAVMARLQRPPAIPPGLPDRLAEPLAAMTRADPLERPSAARCAELLADAARPQLGPAADGVAWMRDVPNNSTSGPLEHGRPADERPAGHGPVGVTVPASGRTSGSGGWGGSGGSGAVGGSGGLGGSGGVIESGDSGCWGGSGGPGGVSGSGGSGRAGGGGGGGSGGSVARPQGGELGVAVAASPFEVAGRRGSGTTVATPLRELLAESPAPVASPGRRVAERPAAVAAGLAVLAGLTVWAVSAGGPAAPASPGTAGGDIVGTAVVRQADQPAEAAVTTTTAPPPAAVVAPPAVVQAPPAEREAAGPARSGKNKGKGKGRGGGD
ncbi:MAG TPA: serine/threonine-protein kinase [Pseudonocardiaceae bacterium]